MRTLTLSTLVQLTNSSLSIGLRNGTSIDLINETCHYLFSTRREKKEFIDTLSEDGLIIFNCSGIEYGISNIERIVSDLPTFDQLISELEALLVSSTIDVILKTLIIDNISMYFWDLRCLNQRNHSDLGYRYNSAKVYYSTLVELIHKIKEKYKCNVIITSWDVKFEKGYNFSWKNQIGVDSIDSLSYLPANYLLSFDHIMHKDSTTDRYFRKSIQKWVTLGKTSLQK